MSTVTLPDPDRAVLARRNEVVKQLKKLAPQAVMIADLEGRRTFESDALAAYRRLPLAVVLPASTEEVSSILRFCNEKHDKVVPRGAGTSLCGGAKPLEDSSVLLDELLICVFELLQAILDVLRTRRRGEKKDENDDPRRPHGWTLHGLCSP